MTPMHNAIDRAPRLYPPYWSRLSAGFEHDRFKCLARALAGPQHELEGLVVTLAGVKRHAEQSLALGVRRRDAAGEHQRMAEHDDAVFEPDVEMSDPKLLVDERRKLGHFGAAALRHLEIECARKVQSLDLWHPCEGDMIVGPTTGDQERHFVVACPGERPLVDSCEPFDDVDRVVAVLFDISQRHIRTTYHVKPVSTLPTHAP